MAAKASALRINLNIQGCSVLAPSLHAPSRAPLLLATLLATLLSHTSLFPRVHYCLMGTPSPHKPRLVVSHSTCPPLSSSSHAHSFVLGTAVINTTHNSKVGLVTAKASALRINLNIQGCSLVAPPLHAPSHAPLLLPLLLSHNIPLRAE